MKQLYDVSTLIDVFENIEEVKRTEAYAYMIKADELLAEIIN